MSNSLRLHGLKDSMLPCPSPTPGACSNSCPLSWWCHPTTASLFLLVQSGSLMGTLTTEKPSLQFSSPALSTDSITFPQSLAMINPSISPFHSISPSWSVTSLPIFLRRGGLNDTLVTTSSVQGLLKAPALTSCEELTYWKRPWCWEGLGAGGEGDNRGWDGWMASLTQWAWVWVNSRSWWWTGRPGVLRFMGSQSRTRLSDWTELNEPQVVRRIQ